jgi:hypothetical protein
MIHTLENRVYRTHGEIFSKINEATNFLKKHSPEVIKTNLKDISFDLEDDILVLFATERKFPLSTFALKNIASMLKVPANYLNKSLSEELVLKNLNANPLKVDQPISINIKKFDETSFVTSILLDDFYTLDDFLTFLPTTFFLEENNLEIADITIEAQEIWLYALGKETEQFSSQSYKHGVVLHLIEGGGFSIKPFFRMYFKDGDSFDFVQNKALEKVSAKEKSFGIFVQDTVRMFKFDQYQNHVPEVMKAIEAVKSTADISYKFLKTLKSGVSRTFSYQAGVYETATLMSELLPEFEDFKRAEKERISELPSFESNNLMLPFDLLGFFSKFEANVMTLEHPLFFNRQRLQVAKWIMSIAEDFYK